MPLNRIIPLLAVALLLFSGTPSIAGKPTAPIQPAPIRIAIAEMELAPLGDALTEELLENMTALFHHQPQVVFLKVSAKTVADHIDREAEVWVTQLLQENDCSYLVYIRRVKKEKGAIEIWNNHGVFDNLYIPLDHLSRKRLMKTTTNFLVSTLHDMDEQIEKTVMY